MNGTEISYLTPPNDDAHLWPPSGSPWMHLATALAARTVGSELTGSTWTLGGDAAATAAPSSSSCLAISQPRNVHRPPRRWRLGSMAHRRWHLAAAPPSHVGEWGQFKKNPTITQNLSRWCIAMRGESVSTYPHRPKAEVLVNAVDVVERLCDPTDPSTERRAHPFSTHSARWRPSYSWSSWGQGRVSPARRHGYGDDEVTGTGLRLSTMMIWPRCVTTEGGTAQG